LIATSFQWRKRSVALFPGLKGCFSGNSDFRGALYCRPQVFSTLVDFCCAEVEQQLRTAVVINKTTSNLRREELVLFIVDLQTFVSVRVSVAINDC
jgi:hypothetical protein